MPLDHTLNEHGRSPLHRLQDCIVLAEHLSIDWFSRKTSTLLTCNFLFLFQKKHAEHQLFTCGPRSLHQIDISLFAQLFYVSRFIDLFVITEIVHIYFFITDCPFLSLTSFEYKRKTLSSSLLHRLSPHAQTAPDLWQLERYIITFMHS